MKYILATALIALLFVLSAKRGAAQGIRIIAEDYDAPLAAVAGQSGSGKVEWKQYKEGDTKLSIKLRDLNLPQNAEIEVLINGSRITTVLVNSGRAKKNLKSAKGESVPKVSADDTAEIRYSGRTVMKGVFVPD